VNGVGEFKDKDKDKDKNKENNTGFKKG